MPIWVGRSNATLSPVCPSSRRMAEAAIRLGGGAEAGVLAHRPEPAAVHRRLHAARERELAGIAKIARVVDRRVCRDGRQAQREGPRERSSWYLAWRSVRRVCKIIAMVKRGAIAGASAPPARAQLVSIFSPTRSCVAEVTDEPVLISTTLTTVAIVGASGRGAQAKRPMSFNDIMELKNVGIGRAVARRDRRSRTPSAGGSIPTRAPSPTRQAGYVKGRSPRRSLARLARRRRAAARRGSSRSVSAASRGRRGRPTASRSRSCRRAAPARREDADLDSADGRRRGVSAHRRRRKRSPASRGRRTDAASPFSPSTRFPRSTKPSASAATTRRCSRADSACRTAGSSTSLRRTRPRVVHGDFTVKGAPTWSPDGQSLAYRGVADDAAS